MTSYSVFRNLSYAAVGAALGVFAWGISSSPAVSLILPLLWALAPSRGTALTLTLSYHLAVSRFAPPLAGVWFDSLAIGVLIWVGAGLVAASTWVVLWPGKRSLVWVWCMTFTVLLASMALPWAAVVTTGSPLAGLGYLVPRTGWFGVGLYFIALPTLATLLTKLSRSDGRGKVSGWGLATAMTFAIAVFVGAVSDRLEGGDQSRGRIAGRIGTINTEWGKFPNDEESLRRMEKIGRSVQSLAGGPDGFDTVVFPETIIGQYEVGSSAVLKGTVLMNAKDSGQTVVIGADLAIGNGRYQNVAVVFRPDGTTSYIAARQTPPIATWAPWLKDGHFPADWLANSTASVASGIRGRFMFCFEEYMPVLHLISEAREDHQLVIAMSNGWATRNPVSSAIQSGHTEGMAKLFGKPWIRAENRALPSSTATP